MKNIAIVNLMDITPYFYKKISGITQIEIIENFCSKLPHTEKVIFLTSKNIPELSNTIVKEDWNESSFIETLEEETRGFNNLFYYFGDSPLMDITLTKEMLNDHISYYSEYTFADGYPYGLTPEIIDINIIPALKILTSNSKNPISRTTFFDIIKKDINSFEIETKIAEKDQRLLRVSLTTDSKRNYNQLIRIINSGGKDYKSVTNLLETNQELLFTEPSFATIEITKEVAQNVNYLPKRVNINKNMDITLIDKILKELKEYSDDLTISFTPEYEPALHPQIVEIIKLITEKYGFKIYMESSGLFWSDDLIKEVSGNNLVNIIFTLDAINEDLYKDIRGEGYIEAYATTKKIVELAKNRVWVQATRMKTNEVDMEPFYRYWQKITENIIIQKYSDYNKSLPDLKVADLSPLKRFPCWHLKRDIHINTEGEALICFNDIKNNFKLGSFIDNDIQTIMANKFNYYKDHIKNNYSDFCRKCDEYYTFNF